MEGIIKIAHFYHIKNGARRTFNPGFHKGFIALKSAEQVRVVGISRKKKQEVEIGVGIDQKVNLETIYPDTLFMIPLSEQTGRCTLQNIDRSDKIINEIHYVTISCPVLLDCDADRDGVVGYDEPGKANWVWGPEGRGAILLVNNDEGKSEMSPYSKQSEYAELIVRSTGLSKSTWDKLGLELRLYATPLAVNRFRVYRLKAGNKLEQVLPDKKDENENENDEEINLSKELNPNGERLLVEARQYPGQCPESHSHEGLCPDSHFEGLISIELHLRLKAEQAPKGILLASDRVVYRVAPWIMMPNTLPVERVYTCEITTDNYENTQFRADLKLVCKKLGLPCHVVQEKDVDYRDTWIQDHIEIGYSQGTQSYLPVVFESPREKGLSKYLEKRLLETDFGHFRMAGSSDETLDSFGNLEVSPPVTVRGKDYPLGRIIFGGRSYGSLAPESRKMMQKIRRFLYAQKVQSPIEVFTDWLRVGHVDEIICFIPNSYPPPPGEKEFKVLLASPARAYALLKTLKSEKYGKNVMFKNREHKDGSKGISVNEFLGDKYDKLWEVNLVYQEYMNLNRAILAKHLHLQPNDFIDIPVIFEVWDNKDVLLPHTWPYFPNMINQLVIGHTSIVPKPFGPRINYKYDCAFEEDYCKAMPDGHESIFIDDWYSYFSHLGDIHCGTNTLRIPPTDIKWWDTLPDEGFNI